jgi:hypothetical protein
MQFPPDGDGSDALPGTTGRAFRPGPHPVRESDRGQGPVSRRLLSALP